MKEFFKFKKRVIIAILLFIAVLSGAGLAYFNFKKNNEAKIVRAGTGDNVYGFAWSDNIGWISFNSIDCDINGNDIFEGAGEGAPTDCPSSGAVTNYGVNIDEVTGNFSGYAWSPNIGWISFEETSAPPASAPPDNYLFNTNCSSTCNGSNNCTACYKFTNNNIYGWAKALVLGDNGWIKLSDDSVGAWNGKGAKINSATGDFSGWAWNRNDVTSTSIGWISFNCANNGVCATSNYKVHADIAPPAPSNLTTNPLTCNSMQLNWTDNSYNEIGFETQWSVDGLSNWTSHVPNLNPDITLRTVVQNENTTYYFRVRALGTGKNSTWEPISGGVQGSTGYCPPILSVNSKNCDQIVLNWTYNATNNYNVYRKKDAETDWSELATGLTDKNYIDVDISSNGPTYQYYIKAVTEGLDSSILGPIKPCPNLPKWKEVKPN
jgi:hypothetical protein